MRMWMLLIGLLMLGLSAPFFANVASGVVGQYTDPASQIIIFATLPLMVILFAFFTLFSGE